LVRTSSLILCFAAFAAPAVAQDQPGNMPLRGIATVLDGDTVAINGQRIRLFGIDAFEADQRCGDSGQVPCGGRATEALRQLIGSGELTCTNRGADRYGRTLGVCRADTTDVNAAMVRQGWAVAYRQYSNDYVFDEDSAKSAKAGAWAGKFTLPWDYRAGGRGQIAEAQRTDDPAPADGCVIKGNINSKGEKIYHMPGDNSYARTKPEAMFCSEDEAARAGFRRAHRPQ
jgi:endonuclease YncB( thermonuclease family)